MMDTGLARLAASGRSHYDRVGRTDSRRRPYNNSDDDAASFIKPVLRKYAVSQFPRHRPAGTRKSPARSAEQQGRRHWLLYKLGNKDTSSISSQSEVCKYVLYSRSHRAFLARLQGGGDVVLASLLIKQKR